MAANWRVDWRCWPEPESWRLSFSQLKVVGYLAQLRVELPSLNFMNLA